MPIKPFDISKNVKLSFLYWLCLLSCATFSQSTEKQIIRVEKMEYAYNSTFSESSSRFDVFSNSRIILPTNSGISDKMKQSVLNAISNRWNAVILNPEWDLKEINSYGKPPKFKTNLKKGTPGSWHLFFQVIDNGSYPIAGKSSSSFAPTTTFESLNYTPYYLQFKVLIIDGSNGSTIFSNEMMVEMQRTPVPAGQVLLQKLPALTDSYLQAFDSSVQTLFAVSPQNELKLNVTPACLFLDADKTLANAQKLNFTTKDDSIIELLQLKQEWIIESSKTRKTKRKNNFGNNLFNSTFTTLTGISTDKIRAMGYVTKLGFIDTKDNARYFCEVHFIEETREEKEREVSRDANGTKEYNNYLSGNKSVSRSLDSKKISYLIRDKDTIGHFNVTIGNRSDSKNHFSQYWDGQNESTISTMPEFWNNTFSGQNGHTTSFTLEGELNKLPFIIENSKAGNQIDIEINGHEIMTLKIYNNKPVFGLLYSNSVDEKIVDLLMMLSSLPFNLIL